MTTETPNRIAELRKARGLTQQALADAVGAHWITISKLERGKLPLSFEWAEKLGEALGVGQYAVFKKNLTSRPVFVDGIIQEGGSAYYFRDDKGKEDYEAHHVEIDLERKGNTNWFVIDNDGFFPFFQTNDLVQVEWISTEDDDLFINRLCLIDLKDTDEKLLDLKLGFVVHGSKRQLYNLNILSGAPIKNVKLKSVAVVTMALFNPPVWGGRNSGERDDDPET